MPIFRYKTTEREIIALVSYKVLYCQFQESPQWEYVREFPIAKLCLQSMLKMPQTIMVVRNPFQRVESCFKDKLRKEPMRIDADDFVWQYCQKLVLNKLEIDNEASDETKAQALLNLPFSDFVSMLPDLAKTDGHTMPQVVSKSVFWRGRPFGFWPCCRHIRIGDAEMLSAIPGLTLDRRTNSTEHIQASMNWDEGSQAIIHELYHRDFALGNYSLKP